MTFDVKGYWERRYSETARGSGAGSVGEHAESKAAQVNAIIREREIRSVVDWGCGDGEVAQLIKTPVYTGLDISPTAIATCRRKMPERPFRLFDGVSNPGVHADLALSLDVLYHLIDDDLYHRYLELLCESAPLVCVVATHKCEVGACHVLHREWTRDLPADWKILTCPPAPLWGDRGLWLLGRVPE